MYSIGSIDGRRVKEREGGRERTAMNRINPPIRSGSRFRISTRLSKGQSIANRRDRHWLVSANSSSFTRSVGTARCIPHCCEYLDEILHEKCVTNVRQDFETSRWSMQSISFTVRLFGWANLIDSKTKKSWRISYASTWSEGQHLFLLRTFLQVSLSLPEWLSTFTMSNKEAGGLLIFSVRNFCHIEQRKIRRICSGPNIIPID